MRHLQLLLLVLLATALQADDLVVPEPPLLIPVGGWTGALGTEQQPLASRRHVAGALATLEMQGLPRPERILVLLRSQGRAIFRVRGDDAAAAPLLEAEREAGAHLLELPFVEAADLTISAEAAAPVAVEAQAYLPFAKPGLMEEVAQVAERRGGRARRVEDDPEARDPALRPFREEANNLKQILVSMIAYTSDHDGAWPFVAVEGIPLPPRTAEEGRLLTAAALEVLAHEAQLPGRLFVSPFGRARQMPAPRGRAAIAAAPDPAWAEDVAFDWSVPSECAAYRIVVASRHFATHPQAGLVVNVIAADGSARRLRADPGVEVQDDSTIGLAGFGDGFLPAVPNPDAIGTGDDGTVQPDLPDNIFDNHGDGDASRWGMPNAGDSRRAFLR